MENIEIEKIKNEVPLIIELDNFFYPFMVSSIFVSDELTLKTIDFAMENNLSIIITPKTDENLNLDSIEDMIFPVGTLCKVIRKTELPTSEFKVVIQGLKKVYIKKVLPRIPLLAKIKPLNTNKLNEEYDIGLIEFLETKLEKLIKINKDFPDDILKELQKKEVEEIDRLIDIIVSSLQLPLEKSYDIFQESDIYERIAKLVSFINYEIEKNNIKKKITNRVREKLAKYNKEHFLKQQLKEIEEELGETNSNHNDLKEYQKKLEAKKSFMQENAYKEVKKQLERLGRMHPESSEANLLHTYIEWVLELPFGKFSENNINIQDVETQLNKDHYSLKKPKDRIIEYFAVKELIRLRGKKTKDVVKNGVILCFVGPPGVGKTSLANSIATALNKKLVRIALGGLEDINELRGHRRTYVGAMPGRITQGLIEAKEMNPVVVLDEIDKLGQGNRGDPTSAMLEILDPEQNNKFRDYYLNFDLDLSSITFIATANNTSSIPAPLRDRMEFIQVNSYTPQEKYHIAKKYLIPQELKKHGLQNNEVTFSKKAIEIMISNYTREAGVRNLRRRIGDICRKSAKIFLEDNSTNKISVTIKNLKDFLEKEVFEIDLIDKTPKIGIVTGLAWTSVGGDVLKIEAIKIKGKGNLKLTGKLGDVMKESAQISFSVVKTLFDSGYLESEEESIYDKYDLHIHVPDGATPKDGPSAGIAMTTVIASILSGKKVRGDTAMTGEISLHGNVMPIGGLKEKMIAGHKAGVENIIIPKKNYDKDLIDIPDEVKNSIKIIGVEKIEEVLDFVLV